jgi:hypothetical protein
VAVAAAEVPALFTSVTETEPTALMFPVNEIGTEKVNWLPKFSDAELWYHALNVGARFTAMGAAVNVVPGAAMNWKLPVVMSRVLE